MKETIRLQQEEEQKKRKEKQVAGKKLLHEVLEANNKAIHQKQQRKQEEKEEDERILKWQEAKRMQEEAHEQEKARIKAERDKEFFELASRMKRSQDNRSEEDAMRAKRHQQEQERKQREKERADQARRQAQLEELQLPVKNRNVAKLRTSKLWLCATSRNGKRSIAKTRKCKSDMMRRFKRSRRRTSGIIVFCGTNKRRPSLKSNVFARRSARKRRTSVSRISVSCPRYKRKRHKSSKR